MRVIRCLLFCGTTKLHPREASEWSEGHLDTIFHHVSSVFLAQRWIFVDDRQLQGHSTAVSSFSSVRGKHNILAISPTLHGPPCSRSYVFQITPDHLVDLSEFSVEGENIIHLSQKQDMSLYTFFLFVHHPTPKQLEQVAMRRKADEDWNSWLVRASRPFEMPASWFPWTCFVY